MSEEKVSGGERACPKVWESKYDVRVLLNAAPVMSDGHRKSRAPLLEALDRTDVGNLLHQYGLTGKLDEDHLTVAVCTSSNKEVVSPSRSGSHGNNSD